MTYMRYEQGRHASLSWWLALLRRFVDSGNKMISYFANNRRVYRRRKVDKSFA